MLYIQTENSLEYFSIVGKNQSGTSAWLYSTGKIYRLNLISLELGSFNHYIAWSFYFSAPLDIFAKKMKNIYVASFFFLSIFGLEWMDEFCTLLFFRSIIRKWFLKNNLEELLYLGLPFKIAVESASIQPPSIFCETLNYVIPIFIMNFCAPIVSYILFWPSVT